MKSISTLMDSGCRSVILYKTRSCDGVMAKYSHGRMDWYLVDSGDFIDVDWYSYWEPA